MDVSERYHLVSELERIKRRESRNWSERRPFELAFGQFVISAVVMDLAIRAGVDRANTWFVLFLALLCIAILASGIYGIARYIVDKESQMIIEAILSEKRPEAATPEKE